MTAIKTLEQRRALGNPGHRTEVTPQYEISPRTDMKFVRRSVKQTIEAVLEAGVPWLGKSDEPMIAILRDTLEEREVVRNELWRGRDARLSIRELDKQIISLCSELGFSPAARTRLGLAEVRAASKLEQLQANRSRKNS